MIGSWTRSSTTNSKLPNTAYNGKTHVIINTNGVIESNFAYSTAGQSTGNGYGDALAC